MYAPTRTYSLSDVTAEGGADRALVREVVQVGNFIVSLLLLCFLYYNWMYRLIFSAVCFISTRLSWPSWLCVRKDSCINSWHRRSYCGSVQDNIGWKGNLVCSIEYFFAHEGLEQEISYKRWTFFLEFLSTNCFLCTCLFVFVELNLFWVYTSILSGEFLLWNW